MTDASTALPASNGLPGSNATVAEPTPSAAAEQPPSWGLVAIVVLLCLLIAVTVIGNTLIIAAVLTTRRLRTVTNCFVMSLAVADWLVGLFVMPPKVMKHLIGYWPLGPVLCDIWISLDILLCTASILSLCAISVDRYLAVTQPLNYSRRRRSKRLALLMIFVVWMLALAITCPPIFFFNDEAASQNKSAKPDDCNYNEDRGYVVFSAMGSFFLPLTVMLYVYARISCVIARRHSQLTSLDRTAQRSSHLVSNHEESDMDRGSSECEDNHVGAGRCSSKPRKGKCVYSLQRVHFPRLARARLLHRASWPVRSVISPGVLDYAAAAAGHGRPLRAHYSYCPTAPPCAGGGDHATHLAPPHAHANAHGHANAHVAAAAALGALSSTPKRCSFYGRSKSVRSAGSRPESLALDVTAVDASGFPVPLPLEPSSRVSSFRRESKTAQTLSIVVGGFVACWLPFFISYIIGPFMHTPINELVMDSLVWLGWINSAINPFIYAFYSPDFRIAFWRLTFRQCSGPRRPTDPSIRIHK